MQIEINGLSKQYGNVLAVNEVDATLEFGVYGLLGENGAGKSTLMKLLCNLQNPTKGIVRLNGVDTRAMEEQYFELLGYLPQKFSYYPEYSIDNFLLFVGAVKGLTTSQIKEQTDSLLKIFGLWEVKNKKMKTLSGGMKQRVGIVQALINNPKILILDEPTVGLDPTERAKFRNVIRSYAKDKIVILSTHIVNDIENIADKVLIMKEGRIIVNGTQEEILKYADIHVWQCVVNFLEADRITSNFQVVDQRNIDIENVQIRVISNSKPTSDAVRVELNLEDLYLSLFKEEQND
jgi:ABC-type multidrug transport system, ATPase component